MTPTLTEQREALIAEADALVASDPAMNDPWVCDQIAACIDQAAIIAMQIAAGCDQ